MEFVSMMYITNVRIGVKAENRMPDRLKNIGNRSLRFARTMSRVILASRAKTRILMKMGSARTAVRSKNASPSISRLALKHLLSPQ